MSEAQTVAWLEEAHVARVLHDYESERPESTYEPPRPSHDLGLRRVKLLSAARACIDGGGDQKMRGPLHAIVAAAGVLRDQVTETQAAQVDAIAALASRSDAMVRDLLD